MGKTLDELVKDAVRKAFKVESDQFILNQFMDSDLKEAWNAISIIIDMTEGLITARQEFFLRDLRTIFDEELERREE